MKDSISPIGKLRPTNKIEIVLPSVEDNLRLDRRASRRDRIDSIVQGLGRGLRSVVNTFDVDSARPTTNPNTNSRAGRTAIATMLFIATAALTGVAHQDTSEAGQSNDCSTYDLKNFGTDPDPRATASKINAKLHVAGAPVDSDRLIRIEHDLKDDIPVKICGPAVELVDQQISERSQNIASLNN